MLQAELSVPVGLYSTFKFSHIPSALTSKSIVLLISENLNSSDETFSGEGQRPLRGHPSPTCIYFYFFFILFYFLFYLTFL